MNNELKKVESRIYMKYFGDGLWDICIGIVIANFGLGLLFDLPYFAGISAPLLFAAASLVKSKITYPRIGYIKFKQARKRLAVLFIVNLLLLGIVAFTAFGMNKDSSLVIWLHGNTHLVLGIVFAGIMVLVGYLAHSTRFYGYAALIFLCSFLSKWIGSLELSFTIAGIAIVAVGGYVLYHFISNHPLEPSNEG